VLYLFGTSGKIYLLTGLFCGPASSISPYIVRTEMKAKDHKPVSAVVTVPDPDNKDFMFHAEKGGTLQWRSDSTTFPRFEIQFIGANPSNDTQNEKLDGDNLHPVVINLKKTGDYQYKVRHIKGDGTDTHSGPRSFHVIPCTGCP
jgi:hypothetical protein